MADIVNLNRWRKAKARDEDQKTATANRAAFGRTKAQKQADQQRRDQVDRLLDGARLEQDKSAGGEPDGGGS